MEEDLHMSFMVFHGFPFEGMVLMGNQKELRNVALVRILIGKVVSTLGLNDVGGNEG
jgi:hypothetical protein